MFIWGILSWWHILLVLTLNMLITCDCDLYKNQEQNSCTFILDSWFEGLHYGTGCIYFLFLFNFSTVIYDINNLSLFIEYCGFYEWISLPNDRVYLFELLSNSVAMWEKPSSAKSKQCSVSWGREPRSYLKSNLWQGYYKLSNASRKYTGKIWCFF